MFNNYQDIYFAAVGDVHGYIYKMIRLLQNWENSSDQKLAFILQVGDFEPHRHFSYQLSVISYQLLVISYQLSVISTSEFSIGIEVLN